MYIMCTDMGGQMFNGAVSSYSYSQIELISWCRYYNTHYFSIEENKRPNEKTFKYNALFDRFVKAKEFRQKEETRRARTKSKGSGSTHTWRNY